MTVVRMAHPNRVSVRVNDRDSGVLNQVSSGGVSVRTGAIATVGGARVLDDLGDVVVDAPSEGETLVYDSSTGKFVANAVSVDGGEF